ncbi:MAG: hypothetical protein ACLQB1_18620 [Streptosporangiaceae bacterium]
MTSPKPTPEQYERWRMRVCARCGRRVPVSANWPEGPVCWTCVDRGLQIRGRCTGCGAERLLPGRRADGTPACRDCAGIPRDFSCGRCGSEGRLHAGRLCSRCTLSDKLGVLLDDGSGTISEAMQPLAVHLTAMPSPRAGCVWLASPQVRALLTGLATGQIPLTHQALAQLPNWRTVAHLRDHLTACGALPAADKQLLHFETWLTLRLAGSGTGPRDRLLRQFATWDLLPRLRARAARRPLTQASCRFACVQFTAASAFLTWANDHGRTLGTCSQADLDAWHATHPEHRRRTVRGFLGWAMAHQHMPRLDIPLQQVLKGDPVSQRQRLDLIRRAVTDDRVPLRTRVAACLMLLYAQPVSRLIRLTAADVTQQDGEVLIRLGDPPAPVPEPFAALLLELAGNQPGPATASTPARWLFPGQSAGQPLAAGTMLAHLRALGFPTGPARLSALRQLVLQAPAPVIARSLGFHDNTTTRLAAEAGKTWNQYAPGDHTQ